MTQTVHSASLRGGRPCGAAGPTGDWTPSSVLHPRCLSPTKGMNVRSVGRCLAVLKSDAIVAATVVVHPIRELVRVGQAAVVFLDPKFVGACHRLKRCCGGKSMTQTVHSASLKGGKALRGCRANWRLDAFVSASSPVPVTDEGDECEVSRQGPRGPQSGRHSGRDCSRTSDQRIGAGW